MPYSNGAKALVHVVQSLSSARTLDDVTHFVRTAAREIAQADGATFVLKDEGFCFYADEDAISPLWKGQRFPLSACVSGWAMNNKQALIIEDIYKDPRVPIDAYRPTFVKSLAMTPIRLSNPIGAIGTYWKEQHRPTTEQMEMLQALADTASVALENVNLYHSLEERIDELKQANQAKNEFLMKLSHELRTPLNAIVGWSEIFSEVQWEDESLAKGADAIHRNALAQTHVIDDLLDITQMVSGRFTMKLDQVDLILAVQDALKAVQAAASERQINIEFKNTVTQACVMGDADRLKQVIYYILKNAVKFSSPQKNIEVALTKSGPHLQVRISDHGIGIAPQVLPHIFEVFKQGDGSLTRQYGGLGLGLSIAQHLAEAHRGHLKAESEGLEKGSRFTLSLPSLEA